MDLRYTSNVCDSNFVWSDTNNVAILLMQVVDVEDAATRENVKP
jgi:hypothetical protein